jgi:hypothetical protein
MNKTVFRVYSESNCLNTPGLKSILIIAQVLILLLVISCKPKDLTPPLIIGSGNNPNALVITGYGFSSTVFYLNSDTNRGSYDTAHQWTFIKVGGDTDSLHIQLLIRFNGEGTFVYNDTIPKLYNATDSMTITNKNSQKTTYYSPVYVENYLNITGYDNVGGKINGVISGAFVNSFNKFDSLKISNGRFSVPRLPDY